MTTNKSNEQFTSKKQLADWAKENGLPADMVRLSAKKDAAIKNNLNESLKDDFII